MYKLLLIPLLWVLTGCATGHANFVVLCQHEKDNKMHIHCDKKLPLSFTYKF